jgi:hypothetical protein
VPPESVPIQSIVTGPDGTFTAAGYLVGGFTRFDPKTDQHKQIGNAASPEGMGVYGDSKIFMGIYPRAR